jgi:diguanylate cyclase (GGDEF)-like protein/PAS domain S-box-containing protein
MSRLRAVLLSIFLTIFLVLAGGIQTVFDQLLDWRSPLLSRPVSGDIVVVAIDAHSIRSIGVWPWPRSLHARLVKQLETAGVQDIAFDVDFSSASRPEEDAAFAAALKESTTPITLPAFLERVGDRVLLTQPMAALQSTTWSGIVNVRPDSDGAVRTYRTGEIAEGKFVPSLASAVAGSAVASPSDFYIDYGISPTAIPLVSYADVLNGEPAAFAALKDKKIIVGATALELGDRVGIPPGRVVAGPLVQALAAESLHQNRALQRVGTVLSWSLALAVIGGFLLVWRAWPHRTKAIMIVIAGAAAEGTALWLQSQKPVIWDTAPIVIAGSVFLLALVVDELDLRGVIGRLSENRFKRLTMSLGDALICTDRDGHVTMTNPAAEKMFGSSAAELNGRNIDTLFGNFSFVAAREKKPSDAEEYVGLRASGERFPVEIRASYWDSPQGPQAGFTVRDITQRAAELERIRYLAEVDTLTGVANRNTFQKHLISQLAKISGGEFAVALLLFDLDQFKEINDTLGHLVGDKVLRAVARKLQQAVDGTHLIARLGGDEFAIVVSAPASQIAGDAESFARTIIALFSDEPLAVGSRRLTVGASIGIAIARACTRTPEDEVTELMANADLALYRAKAQGRGRFVFFAQEYRTELEGRLSLERELEKAVREGEFELFYQPQVGLRSGQTVGVEALIRWRHPERGLISPGVFMPVINTSELSQKVATWVIETACRQGAEWERKGFNIRMGVNLAPSLFQSFDLSGFTQRTLAATGFSPELLELEVTEDIVIKDPNLTRVTFEQLRRSGVKLAFDDFGTGYGSLSYLRTFRLDVVKIDRSFVADLANSSDDRSIVSSIISLGHQLGLSIIAEGIEDAATVDALRRLGCDEAQGYFFGKPMSCSEFEARYQEELATRDTAAFA